MIAFSHETTRDSQITSISIPFSVTSSRLSKLEAELRFIVNQIRKMYLAASFIEILLSLIGICCHYFIFIEVLSRWPLTEFNIVYNYKLTLFLQYALLEYDRRFK